VIGFFPFGGMTAEGTLHRMARDGLLLRRCRRYEHLGIGALAPPQVATACLDWAEACASVSPRRRMPRYRLRLPFLMQTAGQATALHDLKADRKRLTN
jgi:hypothetical protein